MKRPNSAIFLDELQKIGGRSSNAVLQKILGWPEARYWNTHAHLYAAGSIEKGRGYSGTVILVPLKNPPSPAENRRKKNSDGNLKSEKLTNEDESELGLYQPVKHYLENHWSILRGFNGFVCEITAHQGRRDTGGSWSRPDISFIAFKNYEFMPEKVLEVCSFEVKHSNDISVKGVMEALSHREAAHRSYVIYNTSGKDFFEYPESKRIEEISSRYGIGIFAAKSINDPNEWAEVVSASRSNPDPEAVDTFISRTISDLAKTKIRKWF
ncbi:hypothetical protein V5F72_02180 [Xanthobacter flavus]|uniref:hypothetical protein n=1 Tax=Xanthobacter flavus TaxID=281 RepID=UPI00372CA49B